MFMNSREPEFPRVGLVRICVRLKESYPAQWPNFRRPASNQLTSRIQLDSIVSELRNHGTRRIDLSTNNRRENQVRS